MTIALIIYAVVALAYWLYMAWGVVQLNTIPKLSQLDAPKPNVWPKVSVVVPGCNEADKVEAAARSILASDYPALEIIFVDDRSTDGTGEVMDRVAAEHSNARVIHVKELPEGWLGKLHAMDAGLKASSGEFVLFTDADVHIAPGTLRRAIAHCEAGRLDHFSALPELYPTHFALDATLSSSVRQLMVVMRGWAVSNPKSRAGAGVGAFNLVRRSAFDRTPGFEWLRLETGDDVALAQMMKDHGARSAFATGFDEVGVHWYRSFSEAARGAEKGWSSAMQFSVLRAAMLAVFAVALEMAPLLLALPVIFTGPTALSCACLAVPALYLFVALAFHHWVRHNIWTHLLSIFFVPVLALFVIRTAWLGWKRGGVVWRGTLYKSEELRKGRRVRFP